MKKSPTKKKPKPTKSVENYFGECEICGHFLAQNKECWFCPWLNNAKGTYDGMEKIIYEK
jgi:hypothetical protein